MSGQLQKDRIPARVLRILAEIKEVWGPPPVLSSEDAKAYDRNLLNLVQCILPEDFMETDADHKPFVMERRFRNQREVEAQRQKRMGREQP